MAEREGNWALALQGLGAGLQGRGAEWQYYQDRARMEQEELEQEARRKYMESIPGANRVFLDHLNSGRINEAFNIANQGIQDAMTLGQDGSVWAERLEWLGGGMVQKAIDDATIDDREFVLQDMIEPMGGDGELPAESLAFNHLTETLNDPNVPDNVRSAAAIKLGIDPRATTPQVVDVGGVPKLWVPKDEKLYDFDINGRPITATSVGESKAEIAGAVESGKQGIQLSKEYMEKVALIDKGIINVNKAITAIDKGAKSGAVQSLLPSVRAASIELDNVRNQMGLDIIGATTFGALSESELAFALDTAMPDSLDEPVLKDWLIRKRDAQTKLRGEFERAARFLSRPGNTLNKYYQALESRGMYEKKDTDPLGLFD